MANETPRVGLLGGGTIAQHVWKRCIETNAAKVEWIWMRQPDKWPSDLPGQPQIFSDLDEALKVPVDLIVEAAHPEVVKQIGEQCLAVADFMVLSLTALVDDETNTSLRNAAESNGRRLIAPHGAVLGLDGIIDAGDLLQEVTITTSKHPKTLENAPAEGGVLFEGSTREACDKFPTNINVHAAVALAGIGFDRTVSRIVADPSLTVNRHVIEVKAEGITFKIEVASESGGKLTGAYTPESTYASMIRALNRDPKGLVIL